MASGPAGMALRPQTLRSAGLQSGAFSKTPIAPEHSMKTTVKRVAVLGGARIPFARSNTTYAEATNKDMLTAAFRGVVDKFQLHGERLGEVAAGAVLKHSRDFNLCRESVLSSGLSPETPAFDLQMACGTGLQAAVNIGNKIALGQIEVGIAGEIGRASCRERVS
jgi:acetyl-CoA C-acetyltransferase